MCCYVFIQFCQKRKKKKNPFPKHISKKWKEKKNKTKTENKLKLNASMKACKKRQCDRSGLGQRAISKDSNANIDCSRSTIM